MFRLLPLIAAASCLTFIVPTATAAEHAEEKYKCIKACNDCLRACRECLIGCDCPECEKTCLTCLETCRSCAALMEYE